MKRVFNKNFKFSVERYEEWQDQKCISSGEIDGTIYCSINGDVALFLVLGMDKLAIDQRFSFDIKNRFSMILDVNQGGLVTSPRIQYMSNTSRTNTEPFLCHLFCEYGRIVKVRFAFSDGISTGVFPMTKRIYEFSGDMEELGELSDASVQVLKNRFIGVCTKQPKLVYDQYSLMVDSSDFNPFNITNNPQLNSNLSWNDMTEIFKVRLNYILPRCLKNGMDIKTALPAFVFNAVESYYDKASFVPKAIVDRIIEDVFDAFKSTPYFPLFSDIEELRYFVYYNFTHK